jgi:voltage-gated sodium channel
MTLESWSMGIARPVMEEFPHAYLLFIPFILIATYTTLNIFIAIVVNTMSEIHEDDIRREKEALGEIIEEEHEETDSEIADLKLQLNRIEQQIAELSNKIDSK